MERKNKEKMKNTETEKVEKWAIKTAIRHPIAVVSIAIVILGLIIGLIVYFDVSASRVYIDKAEIDAPIITLSPASSGVLEDVFVKEGDFVHVNTAVAQVNGQQIFSKVDGIILSVQNTPGQIVSSQTPVVTMIDPSELRMVGHLSEDKGLSEVKVGQKVIFRVDAFGAKDYYAIVDGISPTSRQSAIVFSISDKREEKQFDVKAKFDVNAYPELKNGMSAVMWVYK